MNRDIIGQLKPKTLRNEKQQSQATDREKIKVSIRIHVMYRQAHRGFELNPLFIPARVRPTAEISLKLAVIKLAALIEI